MTMDGLVVLGKGVLGSLHRPRQPQCHRRLKQVPVNIHMALLFPLTRQSETERGRKLNISQSLQPYQHLKGFTVCLLWKDSF